MYIFIKLLKFSLFIFVYINYVGYIYFVNYYCLKLEYLFNDRNILDFDFFVLFLNCYIIFVFFYKKNFLDNLIEIVFDFFISVCNYELYELFLKFLKNIF